MFDFTACVERGKIDKQISHHHSEPVERERGILQQARDDFMVDNKC
jgi:hypothetical protein